MNSMTDIDWKKALEPLLVTKRHGAQMLGLCERTIDYLIAAGELPVRRVGRRSLLPLAALKAFARKDTPVVPKPARKEQGAR